MISSEVQRTLVKSPPELWAELSDPDALARHLGELGEIRITRIEPEKLVEWEAEGTRGSVAIKASGWGTKVTLTASRELPVPGPSEPEASSIDVDAPPTAPSNTSAAAGLDLWAGQEAELADQPRITAAERFAHDDPEPLLGTRLGSEHELAEVEADEDGPTDASSEPPAESPEPTEPRRGFLARLFGRRRKRAETIDRATTLDGAAQDTPSPEPSISAQAASDVLEAPAPPRTTEEPLPSETEAIEDAEPASVEPASAEPETSLRYDEVAEQAPPEPVVDIAAELKQAEEAASEEVTAVLTGMLDRLGAAHHRPFSRA